MSKLPTVADIEAAAQRIAGEAIRTPLLYAHTLSAHLDRHIWIKPEMLQRTGSFKFRGAFNKLSQIPEDQKANGVVAWSSGNHAQGVAAAAKILSIPATIVMPQDAPTIKIEGTRTLGADVVFFDRYTEDRETIGRAIVAKTGATLVPSYDDADIIAGQGTLGLEIAQDLKGMGVRPDEIIMPCGGGGLSSGTGLALKSTFPDIGITLVEPQHYDDFGKSLISGKPETVDVTRRSLCDALLTPTPGQLTLALNRQLGARAVSVSDPEVVTALRTAFADLKLVVEPGGAVALAAVLAGKMGSNSKNLILVLSGGNVDPALYRQLLIES
ncbi:MAG: threonine/serine dehydratase [Alphaproteobacteria bacterium]|nr:MAG: threonine/serine dehydratase [Alphaproteobacteria bacterium]